MDKPIFETVMERLREKRISQREVSAGSGVPFSTVTKIAQGNIKHPRVHHVQALFDYFRRVETETERCTCHGKKAA
jgi:predicted transcriptional regulator